MKSELESLSDRHLRPDPDGVLKDKADAKTGIILITQDIQSANTVAGQHTIWMLVNLLSRQFGLVKQLIIDVPDVQAIANLAAFGQAKTLRETLFNCVDMVAGEYIEAAEKIEANHIVDFQLILGNALQQRATNTIYLHADGWKWYVGKSQLVIDQHPKNKVTIGPYLAACFASGEVFKELRGMIEGKGEFISRYLGSAWDSKSDCENWNEVINGPDCSGLPNIGHVYLAGAGAVGQSAILTLATSLVKGEMTIVDHDILDLSNDNRYAMSHKSDTGRKKVEIANDYLVNSRIKPTPVSVKWEGHVTNAGKKTSNQTIAALEKQYKYTTVLSCVDDNSARHAIQNTLPNLIIGGSTDGMVAKATTYQMGNNLACLKCFNSVINRNEIADNLIKLAKEMNESQRKELCAQNEIEYELLEKIVSTTGCGKVSESDLENFAKGPREMSVGFVSVAAGVLLVTHLLRWMLGQHLSDKNSTFMTFAKPRIAYRTLGTERDCNCGTELLHRWNKLWS